MTTDRTGFELIDAIKDHNDLCLNISWRLRDISRALDTIGMETLADELAQMSSTIVVSAKTISKAHRPLKATTEGVIGPKVAS